MSRSFVITVLLALLLLFTGCAKRSTAYQEADVLQHIANIPVMGLPYKLSHGNGQLYAAMDQGGVAVINLETNTVNAFNNMLAEDGSNVLLSHIRNISYVPEHKTLFVYEVLGTDTIFIVNTSDPDSLKPFDSIIGATQGIKDIKCVSLADDPDGNVMEVLYCQSSAVKYGRFDGQIWTGSELTIDAEISMSSLDMDEDYIYVGTQQQGLFIYSRPTGEFVSQLKYTGNIYALVIDGDTAYLAARHNGLQIADLSDRANPRLLGSFDTTGYAEDLAYKDGKVLLASGTGGAYYIDVSQKDSPKLIQRIRDAGYVLRVAIAENKAIVATRENGIQIYKMD